LRTSRWRRPAIAAGLVPRPDSLRSRAASGTIFAAHTKKRMKFSIFLLLLAGFAAQTAFAQTPVPTDVPTSDSILITIFLKHQQDKNLDSLQAIQRRHNFSGQFPPKSARVVSWYVMMGIGQVVTVKIPAAELRTLNLSIEKGAWGAFDTEFYPTYDYMPIWKQSRTAPQ
jgi:hypothetical protein